MLQPALPLRKVFPSPHSRPPIASARRSCCHRAQGAPASHFPQKAEGSKAPRCVRPAHRLRALEREAARAQAGPRRRGGAAKGGTAERRAEGKLGARANESWRALRAQDLVRRAWAHMRRRAKLRASL